MEEKKDKKNGSLYVPKRPVLMYNGKKYKSACKLSRDEEVDYRKLIKLIKEGYSAEDAIAKIRKKKYQYNGQYFSTKRELADFLGISVRVLEQSNKYKELRREIIPTKKPFIYKGIQYESKDAFYQALGITCSGVRKYALRHNITTQEALEEIANKRLGL